MRTKTTALTVTTEKTVISATTGIPLTTLRKSRTVKTATSAKTVTRATTVTRAKTVTSATTDSFTKQVIFFCYSNPFNIILTQNMANLENAVRLPHNHYFPLLLGCLSLETHFGTLTLQSSLNPITTQDMANLENAVRHLQIIVYS